ncbi:hypothetical protein JD79_02670 [Geodermatophilus normandii]|uniref:CHAT domain-containing protein n=1 Tax=Geodermatophilus normandii TaxID=1137989 RepID=A0A317QL79_9ACTN|nr:hypothetical protein [Geodermatophilus normandii]PWW23496.1 hypothetical protein JD79_02670 [Geodermatophilus normandii]
MSVKPASVEAPGVRRPMRPRVVRLVDIGLDPAFDASMSFVQATLQNINTGAASPIVEVEFVRSRDLRTVGMALTAEAHVLHVMAHGGAYGDDGPTFSSSDQRTSFSLGQLTDDAAGQGRGVRTSTVFADGCKTATGVWQRAFEHVLQGPITYIGTTSSIGWHEATVFGAMFYGVLYRNKGKGVDPAAASMAAARGAAQAYTDLLGKRCPYKAITLEPSAWARENVRPTNI